MIVKKLFVLLVILAMMSCKRTTMNMVSSGVPLFDTVKEEDHFDPNYRPKDTESDNLRGWDPASEDDMEDMGMTRYQENYDDEGWD